MAVVENSEQDKTIGTAGQINELAHDDAILSIDHTTKEGNVAFELVKNCKREHNFPGGNCCLAWERLVAKYEPHSASLYLNLKNGALVSIDEDPDEWTTESLRAQIYDTEFSFPMTDKDFLVHVHSYLLEEYDTVLDGLQRRLLKSGPEKLTNEDA